MSISTGTLCGATTISASHLLTEAIMCVQMLLSFLYFTSILSEVVNPAVQREDENKDLSRPSRDGNGAMNGQSCRRTEGRLSERC